MNAVCLCLLNKYLKLSVFRRPYNLYCVGAYQSINQFSLLFTFILIFIYLITCKRNERLGCRTSAAYYTGGQVNELYAVGQYQIHRFE